MHFQSLCVSLFVASSSALAMRRPGFLDVGSPTPEELAMMPVARDLASTLELLSSVGGCTHLSNIQMNQGALPPPSPGLSLYHVAAGRGTQNYSCPTDDATAPTAVPVALGAVATLFNITCLMTPQNTQIVNQYFGMFANSSIPPTDPNLPSESGHHYFTNGATTATFNLHQGPPSLTGNLGISFSSKTNSTPAPSTAYHGADGSTAVPWLKLTTIGNTPKPANTPQLTISQADMVGHVQEIYRLNTAGGAAPATCGSKRGNFQQEYAAEYWFWH